MTSPILCEGLASQALLWQICAGMGLPNYFFSDSWVVGFLEGLIIAERRITETSFAVGFKPFLDRLGRMAGRQCARSTCRV